MQSNATSEQNRELKAKQLHKWSVGHRPSSKSGIYANNTACSNGVSFPSPDKWVNGKLLWYKIATYRPNCETTDKKFRAEGKKNRLKNV